MLVNSITVLKLSQIMLSIFFFFSFWEKEEPWCFRKQKSHKYLSSIDGRGFFISIDPACWPERWRMPRQRIDVHTASHLRSSPDLLQEPAKKQYGAAAADRTPTLKLVTVSPNTKNENRANPLSLASVKCMNWTCVPQKSLLRTLIYLVVFSLLAVTDLDTWLASVCTRAIIWRLTDLALLLLSFWLSYLCMVLPSA